MSDPNIIAVKNYLNNYYYGHNSWVPIESETTGVEIICGIIRGFQISSGLSSPTGYVGPATLAAMKAMKNITKMDVDDDPNPFVCLIQCALFAKGYAAGGITGIYYNTGEAAISNMQKDAGLQITKIIDWKVWAALLSFNWFTMATSGGGDSYLQKIQRQLNGDWSDYIGVQACDGIMSRNTALSLLGALQVALGVIDEYILDLNVLNFGDYTRKAFIDGVGYLKSGDNTANKIPFNKFVQYGLYFNGFNPYNFNGTFDGVTKDCIVAFQKKYALLDIGMDPEGIVGVSTMMSLVTSKGDTTRPTLGCDCSVVLNQTQANDIKAAGYKYIGRYLTGSVGYGSTERSKALTLTEIGYLKKAGLSVFPIYQDGGLLQHFKNSMQGYIDAAEALSAAKRLGFTKGTTIYFAIDFDCSEAEGEKYIAKYFDAILATFNIPAPGLNSKGYKVGIYAPRLICTMMAKKGYTVHSFVSDMSTGFLGNLGHAIPDNWTFDQIFEFKNDPNTGNHQFPSSPSFDLDKVAVSGKDLGCATFDEGKELNEAEKLKNARNLYTSNVLKSINSLNKYVGYEFNYNGTELPIASYTGVGCSMTATFSTSGTIKKPVSKDFGFDVSFDSNGGYSQDMLDKISSALDVISDPTSRDNVENLMKELALSAKSGNIQLSVVPDSTTSLVISLTAQVEDLFEAYGVHGSVSDTLKIRVSYTNDFEYEGIKFSELEVVKMTNAALETLAAFGYQVLAKTLEAFANPEVLAFGTVLGFLLALMLKYGWVIIFA